MCKASGLFIKNKPDWAGFFSQIPSTLSHIYTFTLTKFLIIMVLTFFSKYISLLSEKNKKSGHQMKLKLQVFTSSSNIYSGVPIILVIATVPPLIKVPLCKISKMWSQYPPLKFESERNIIESNEIIVKLKLLGV